MKICAKITNEFKNTNEKVYKRKSLIYKRLYMFTKDLKIQKNFNIPKIIIYERKTADNIGTK